MFGSRATNRLIFLHVHRTGGTTMRWEVLYKCVDRESIYCVDGHEPPTRGGTVEELLAMPRKDQEKLRVLVGHMPFGLRERLPWPESWHYVTVLREPITRTVSTYYQVRQSVRHRAYADAQRYTLEEYVRNRCWMSWDGMCQHLSNARYGATFESQGAMFEAAMRNAGACSLVGLMDQYDETVRRLCRLYGWAVPQYGVRHNLTPKDRTLSESELELLRAGNVYDRQLYDHFRERFLRQPGGDSPRAWLSGVLGKLWPFRRPAAA